MWDAIQWAASALGIAGAVTNSIGGRLLRITWPIWLLSNVLGICALWHMGAHGFLAQQSFYLFTTLLGGFRQFFPVRWSNLLAGLGDAAKVARRGILSAWRT